MAQVGTGTSLWLVRMIMFALGLGVSLVYIPNQAASMATVTKAETGRASAIFNAGKQLGGAVGVALLSAVLAGVGPSAERSGHLTACHDGFLAAAAVAVISVPVALTASSTSRPPLSRGRAAGNRERFLLARRWDPGESFVYESGHGRSRPPGQGSRR